MTPTGQRIFSIVDPLAQPMSKSELHDAMYSLTADAECEALLLESEPLSVMDSYLVEGEPVLSGFILDAVTTSFARFPRTMKALERALNRSSGIEVLSHEIGTPKKNNLFATVAVQFKISDGQTLTVTFHAPDEDPKVIKPDDVVIAYRWLLNKRDITQVVAPEMLNGKLNDVSLTHVAKRVGSVISANSDSFLAKQKEVLEARKRLQTLEDNIKEQAEDLAKLNDEVAELRNTVQDSEVVLESKRSALLQSEEHRKSLEEKLEHLKSKQGDSNRSDSDRLSEGSNFSEKMEAAARLESIEPRLYRDLKRSMSTIASIDSGEEKGFERSAFVSSITNKIKTRFNNNQQEVVDAALDYIKENQESRAKPFITNRNGIWKLHSQAAGTTDEKVNELTENDEKERLKHSKEALLMVMSDVKLSDGFTWAPGGELDQSVTVSSPIPGVNYEVTVDSHSATFNVTKNGSPLNSSKGSVLTTAAQIQAVISDDFQEVAQDENVGRGSNGEDNISAVKTLNNIVNGLHDDVAADDILEMIEEAVEQLEELGMTEMHDSLIGLAAEKYAELDEAQE